MRLADLAQQARSLADQLARIAHNENPSFAVPLPPDTPVAAAQRYLRLRRRRDDRFPDHLFADPAWDMLLELFVADETGRHLSITGACIAGAVPATTGLRWVALLEKRSLVVRQAFPGDRRVHYLQLTPHARDLVVDWLEQFMAAIGGVAPSRAPAPQPAILGAAQRDPAFAPEPASAPEPAFGG